MLFYARNLILRIMSRCLFYSTTLKIFIKSNSLREHKILYFFCHTFNFHSFFLCLFKQLPDNCGSEDVIANVKRVEKMSKQWVKILLASKDKNSAAVLLFILKTIAKLKTEAQVSQMLDNSFWYFTKFMRVFFELTEFNYIWNRKPCFYITFSSNFTHLFKGKSKIVNSGTSG